ncbi:MAG: hypothetical protein HWQ40_25710 [Nostoc sp. NMS9]|nr:hypothetical protein [Nostoc sp. NMS9]
MHNLFLYRTSVDRETLYKINDVFNPILVLWLRRSLNLQSKNLEVNA